MFYEIGFIILTTIIFFAGITIVGYIGAGLLSLFTSSKVEEKVKTIPPTVLPVEKKPLPVVSEVPKKKVQFISDEIQETTANAIDMAKVYKEAKYLEWFAVKDAQQTISESEKIIAYELDRYDVKYYREVAFKNLLIKYGHARFDFLIQFKKTIHLIEYDSELWHNTEESKHRDRIKTQFCKDNNIPLTRYNKKHYYNLEEEIDKLMKQYGVKLKSNH